MASIPSQTKLFIGFIGVTFCGLGLSCEPQKVLDQYKPQVEAKSPENTTFYALGRILGRGLDKFDLSEEEIYLVHKGMYDEILGKASPVDYGAFEAKISELLTIKRALAVNQHIETGKKFLATLTTQGFETLQENLYIKHEREGKPLPESEYARVTITGQHANGKTFAFFENARVYLKSLPSGLQIGIRETGIGGKSQVAFNYEYGFGYTGSGNIEGGEALLFQIDVLPTASPDSSE